MPFEIHEEIARSNGPLKDWICDSTNKAKLLLEESVGAALVTRVLTAGYAPDGRGLDDAELEEIGRDPFLVAYALAAQLRTVVTKEVSKPSKRRANRKLPDVCRDLGVACINDFDLFRALHFTTAGS